MRWFGEPWPDAENPAPICDDPVYRVDTPIGRRCLYCPDPIRARERGILMATSWESDDGFPIWAQDPEDRAPTPRWVVAVHIDCLMRATVGPELETMLAHVAGIERVPGERERNLDTLRDHPDVRVEENDAQSAP